MKRYLTYIIILVACFACEQEVDPTDPSITLASSDFVITESMTQSTDNVNLESATIGFFAKFNESITYELQITGVESGAKYMYQNTADSLEFYWTGSSSQGTFKAEKCLVSLFIFGSDVTDTSSFTITTRAQPEGISLATNEPLETSPQVGFWEPNRNGATTKIFCGKTSQYAYEGEYAYHLEGNNISPNPNRYLGLAYTVPIIGINGANRSGKVYKVDTENADSVRFNIWVYGEGKKDAKLVVKFLQDDNNDGTHTSDQENGFEYPIDDVSHFGWKQFSITYSQITVSGNRQYGGAGDQIHRPNRVTQIEYALWARTPESQPRIIFDAPTFTYNIP